MPLQPLITVRSHCKLVIHWMGVLDQGRWLFLALNVLQIHGAIYVSIGASGESAGGLKRVLVLLMGLCPFTTPVERVTGVASLTAVAIAHSNFRILPMSYANVSFADGHRKKCELCRLGPVPRPIGRLSSIIYSKGLARVYELCVCTCWNSRLRPRICHYVWSTSSVIFFFFLHRVV